MLNYRLSISPTDFYHISLVSLSVCLALCHCAILGCQTLRQVRNAKSSSAFPDKFQSFFMHLQAREGMQNLGFSVLKWKFTTQNTPVSWNALPGLLSRVQWIYPSLKGEWSWWMYKYKSKHPKASWVMVQIILSSSDGMAFWRKRDLPIYL